MKTNMKLDDFLKIVNEALARTDEYADDKFKAGVCQMFERVSFATNRYGGFSNSYWLATGSKEYFADGQPDNPWAEHIKKYIIGAGPGTGEHNRTYFLSKT